MYNVLIIGAGNKGVWSDAPGSGNEHKYLSYGHAVTKHSGFSLANFADLTTTSVKEAGKVWPVTGAKDIDVIVISTSDEAHYDGLKYALRQKPKLVICEKPVCTTIDQAEEMVNAYEYAGIPLLVDYTRRFIPHFREIRQQMAMGKYGDFLKGYCYFNRGWAHSASHFVDLVLWLNGRTNNIEVREVPVDYQWVFQWSLFFEKDFITEQFGLKSAGFKVPEYYDAHLWYVMSNAYNFLQGKEPLRCTGRDALDALKETEALR